MVFRGIKRIRLVLYVALLISVPALGLVSCADLGYYASATRGHLHILKERRPIASLLYSDQTSPELRKSLENVMAMRDFATEELLLPENGSYRWYADLGRPHVVWNVVATPEFELNPIRWCFPVAGCVNYRGFFSREEAEAFAGDLRGRGYDVYSYGVSAYSTLGWFDDPVLNTFLNRSGPDLAGLIFHELAHQKLYVKNDTCFNEGFAKAVELEGVTRWLARHGGEEEIRRYVDEQAREEQWVRLIAVIQEKLRSLFGSPMGKDEKRQEKERIFEEMLAEYGLLKESWGGYAGYDRWFARDLNNAKLASIDTYRSYVPAFRRLLQANNGDLAAFYLETEKLGRLSSDKRLARMEILRSEYLAQGAGELPWPAESDPEQMADAAAVSTEASSEGG